MRQINPIEWTVACVIKHASATNAVFALVLGLLAFLYITATASLL